VVTGDSVFEHMITAHHGEIYRYLRRATGRASDADDLAQETFLRAYRAYRTLPPDANARAWLFTIATNLSRNHFRAQKRRRLAYAAVAATPE
jgi:RNA polymerase sigma-70 factor, ECF subfamily